MRRDTDRRGSIHMHVMDAMCSVMCGYGMQYVVVYSLYVQCYEYVTAAQSCTVSCQDEFTLCLHYFNSQCALDLV